MDPDSLREIALLFFLITLNAFFAASEVAITNVRKARLKQLLEEGRRAAAIAERLAEDSSRFLATIQVGVTLAGFFAAATAAMTLGESLRPLIAQVPVAFIAQSSRTVAVMLVTLLLAFVVLVLGELVPKTIALQYPEAIALFVARPIDVLATLLSPLIRLVISLSNLIASPFGIQQAGSMPFITEEEIMTMVDAGEEEGVIEEDEKKMIYSIFELGDTLAREVMVPRIDVVALEQSTSVDEALDVILAKGHSRIPVYEETIDNIIGLLYAKDLLAYLRDGYQNVHLKEVLRPAYFIPESKKVDELLQDLQQRKVHMAIVVDEYGGTAGLVTIEDILEEIVGEIQDEYDAEESFIEKESDTVFVFNARIDLDDVNRLLDVKLPTGEGDTLGGLIYSQLGKVPAAGDQLVVNGVVIEVLSVSGRRIRKVRVSREVGGVEGEPEGSDHGSK